jgi:hypothetical protein
VDRGEHKVEKEVVAEAMELETVFVAEATVSGQRGEYIGAD